MAISASEEFRMQTVWRDAQSEGRDRTVIAIAGATGVTPKGAAGDQFSNNARNLKWQLLGISSETR
jgi:hypothetical protein